MNPWAGVALGGQASARRLEEQKAILDRLLYASPHPIGIAEWMPYLRAQATICRALP